MDAAQIIQYSLTPAVMISSAALFLLGLQNRFSNLFFRFRALNQERRSLSQLPAKTAGDEDRLRNVTLQLDHLMKRVRCLKNAIVCFYAAILCFIGTCLFLFLNRYAAVRLSQLALGVFFFGMFFIFLASILLIAEVRLAFRILRLERKS